MSGQKIKFGLIGYGGWGSQHVKAIRENSEICELVAISVRSQETCEKAKKETGVNVYQNYEEMLEKEEIDVVDIVVPNILHHQVAISCLKRNKHILLEKPMALTLDECDEIIEEAKKRNRIAYIGFEARLSSLWGKTKEMIEQGKIGKVLVVNIELFRRPYRLGSQGWRFQKDKVGSWILEEPVHFFDLMRWYLSSFGEASSIYARANSKQEDKNLLDNFFCILNFPQNIYGTISFTLCGYEHHQIVKVMGDRGAIWADWSGEIAQALHPQYSLTYFDGEKKNLIETPQKPGEVFELKEEIKKVVKAVRGEEKPFVDGLDGKEAVRLCLASEESLIQEKVISLR